MSRQSIVFFTSTSPQSVTLAHDLREQFDLRAIVIEEKKKAVNQNPVIRLLQATFGQTLLEKLLIYRKKGAERKTLLTEARLSSNAKRNLAAQLHKYNTNVWPDVPLIKTTNINDAATEQTVRDIAPALIVVWGTGIMRRNIIDIPTLGVVNAHTSVLPHYRGSFVEFWQSLHGDYDKAGVTFHFINEKVDEGDIVSTHPYAGPRPADPFSLRSDNVLSVLRYYPTVISSILDGTCTRIPQEKGSEKAYLFKHITLEKKQELYRKPAP